MKTHNYIVIWEPDIWPVPVSSMKVIDAFGTTGTIVDARRLVQERAESYRKRFGPGFVQVTRSDLWSEKLDA